MRLVPAVGEGAGLDRGDAFSPGAGLGEGVVSFIGWVRYSSAGKSSNLGIVEVLVGMRVADKGLKVG